MPRPWTHIETVETPEGPLELCQRGERDFMIRHGGRVLMTTAHHRSEVAIAEVGCAAIAGVQRPKVLIGGAGLGYTLHAALQALPRDASVTIAELNPAVLRWCRGPLSVLTDGAIEDRRSRVFEGDVMAAVRQGPAGQGGGRARDRWDAIIIDLYVGPEDNASVARHPLYGDRALADVYSALSAGGCYAVWGEEPSRRFERGLQRAGFRTRVQRTRGNGPRHVIFVAEKP